MLMCMTETLIPHKMLLPAVISLVCLTHVDSTQFLARDQALTSVPDTIPKDSIIVDLSFNNIQRIPDAAFSGLSQLQTVYLTESMVEEVAEQAFKGTVVEILDLSKNQLDQIPYLHSLNNSLTNLQMSQNSISHVTGQLTGVSMLQSVDLSSNHITNVSLTAFCGTQLTILKLNDNALDKVPQVGRCVGETLTSLSLSDNEITELHSDDFTGLSSLTQLHLTHNHIHTLPDFSLRWLSSLRKLYLIQAGVEIVEDLAFFNTSIITLHLEYNLFHVFPNFTEIADTLTHILLPPISDFSKLTVLPRIHQLSLVGSSSSNTSIPAMGPYLSGVTVFQIWGENHTPVSEDITAGISSLKSVIIKRTSLAVIPHLSQSATSIHTLDLRQNLIQTIQPNDLHNFYKLRTLKLDSNQLTSVQVGAFHDAGSSLKELYLSENPDLGDIAETVSSIIMLHYMPEIATVTM